MEWELSKENVQPVKSGRNVDLLNDALKLKADGSARSNIFEHQRRQMLDAIENYVGDDPIQPWIRCIKWTKDVFPAGGAQSELLKLLEGCTRKFQKEEHYRNDIRYLRVWVQYADCCTDPTDVFAFLEANDIGQTFALFYEAYATTTEVRRNFSRADEIYRLGLSRHAQPLGRLENMYRNFLNRMHRRGERKIREGQQFSANGTRDHQENNEQARAFGSTSHFTVAEQINGRERGRQSGSLPTISRAKQLKNSKIPIFIDPEFGSSEDDPGLLSNSAAAWCHLPSVADGKKENVQKPTKWTEAKIKPHFPGKVPHQTDLNIFVDEEFAETSAPKLQVKSVKSAALPIMKLRLEDMQSTRRTSEHLKGSFLDFQHVDFPSNTISSLKNDSETSRVCTVQGSAAKSVPIVFGYDTAILCGDGTERCFEEVRLTIWNGQGYGLDGLEALLDTPALMNSCSAKVDDPNTKVAGSLLDAGDDHLQTSTTLSPEFTTKGHAGCNNDDSHELYPSSDVQHNTKILEDSGLHLMVETLAAETRPVKEESQAESELQTEAEPTTSSVEQLQTFPSMSSNSFPTQGDETVAIKRFAEEIIVLGADSKVNSMDAVIHHGLVDPTINTKEALADILDMFNKPLDSDNTRTKRRVSKDSKKRTNGPANKPGGFHIFVDEDLETKRPGKPTKSEKRVKSSTQRSSTENLVQGNGFQIFMDEDLGVQRLVQSIPSGSVAQAPTSKSYTLKIFQDEDLGVQPLKPKQRVRSTKLSTIIPCMETVVGPDCLEVFVDDNLDGQKSSHHDHEGEYPETSTRKPLNVCESSSFRIFGDSCQVQALKPQKLEKESSFDLGVYVDEGFQDLCLSPSPSGDREFHHPQQQMISVLDKEDVYEHPQVYGHGIRPKVVDVTQTQCDPPPAPTEGSTLGEVKTKEDTPAESQRPMGDDSDCGFHSEVQATIINSVVTEKIQEDSKALLPSTDVNPWDESTLLSVLARLESPLANSEGFFSSKMTYRGALPPSTARAGSSRSKVIELGSNTYRLKGCVGEGAFAQVFEAEDVDDDFFDDPPKIAIKFQRPACPWEFYIYRQLDTRISANDRNYYGYVKRMHLYADCSFMICDFGEKGTLQDVINVYLAGGQRMDEALCMYYTVEMLRMIEILHTAGIIHGDFKPDNLLIRDDSDQLEEWAPDRPGCWKSQGLSLIDWGRSIDTTLYPDGTKFTGDCKTDSFRCPEMLERRPWTFQVDTFGICGVVHCLLHGNYMQVEKIRSTESQTVYRPKAPYKRYWNVALWREFFHSMLNLNTCEDHKTVLVRLRQAFETHLVNTTSGKKLQGLLFKQNIMMFTRR